MRNIGWKCSEMRERTTSKYDVRERERERGKRRDRQGEHEERDEERKMRELLRGA